MTLPAKRAKRRQKLRLDDMASEIIAIEAALSGISQSQFAGNWVLRSAVERGIERISEASRHVDPAVLAAHPDVPWRQVADIGNWLRHAYDNVDPDQVWRVVMADFGPLKAAIAAMLAALPE
ncbi:HepT-like ribonuclease domain-containing protein [Sandarakinorhabdus sp.]|uniref:HepT-like ribonuclease domain-containing protein n=1 Tax=Sandarakinorhabdus sp. TaxID=1916663 RepID=UPI00333E88BC